MKRLLSFAIVPLFMLFFEPGFSISAVVPLRRITSFLPPIFKRTLPPPLPPVNKTASSCRIFFPRRKLSAPCARRTSIPNK